ncbi:MAG: murein biosynthesis integral membrane protein MurJ [Sporichthyaceae bacterium]
MTDPGDPTAPARKGGRAAGRARSPRLIPGILTGAVLIAVVTVLARTVGFGRWLVFSKTVGAGCLADTYTTANLLPNVAFEVVAGGALAGVVVPLLVGAIARGDRAAVNRTTSALLTWAVLLLFPVTVAMALGARPLMRALLSDDPSCAGAVDTGTRMLIWFTPQLLCYAVAVVLGGALHAHRRFLAAALSPLLSSAVVIAAYLTFSALADGQREVALIPRSSERALALGTTLGVLTLALSVAVPALAAGLRLRPTVRFDDGVAARARSLAAAGLAALLAQQGATLVIAWVANKEGTPGALATWTWAYAVYLVPYAVLALPIATAAFPSLAEAAAIGDDDGRRRDSARTIRAVLLLCVGGAGALAAGAVPVSRMFASNGGLPQASALADAIVGLAPGLVGFALVALLSRILYAQHRGRIAATVMVAGWITAVAAAIALVGVFEREDTVLALALGNSIGMSAAGVGLLVVVVRDLDADARRALVRTVAVALVVAVAVGNLGYRVGSLWEQAGFASATLGALTCAVLAASGYLLGVAALDRAGTQEVLLGLREPR